LHLYFRWFPKKSLNEPFAQAQSGGEPRLLADFGLKIARIATAHRAMHLIFQAPL
jgi:hypothetical protein